MSNDNENARNQARVQFESIKEMVAALTLDWDRLDELRDLVKDIEDRAKEQQFETYCVKGLWYVAQACGVGRINLPVTSDYSATLETVVPPSTGVYTGATKDEALKAWSLGEDDMSEDDFEELSELEAEAGECKDADEARERIQEDALSVQVRSDWHDPSSEGSEATEFQILLCTGGPAVKIEGELGQYGEPESASIFYQDWFTKWEPLELSSEEEEIVLEYCRCFYFGE